MKGKSRFVNVVLLTSGIVALFIGSGLLFIPITFQSSAGIILNDDPGLLSEMRGPGAVILGCGILIVSGVFVSEITFTALVLSTLLYGAYGIARMLSLVVDGTPGTSIIAAMIAEFIIAGVSASALIKFRRIHVKQISSQV